MRAVLALLTIGVGVIGAEIAINLPCNHELDGLLASDPEGNPSAFLSCVGVGVGDIGFWERKFCPNNLIFDFVNQECKEQKKHYRKEQKFNIAILNNSCANGEQCIGGTVCDLESLKCLCPYGTAADLDTLSCVSAQTTQAFNSFQGFKQSQSNFGHAQSNFGPNVGNTEAGFLPNPAAQIPMASTHEPVFTFNFNKFQTPPPTLAPIPENGFPTDFFKPNSNTNTGFGGGDFLPFQPAPPNKPSPTLVGIGAICNELAECDHGSECISGRCVCVAPLVQQDGRCVMQTQIKQVGPGELCDNGEICVKGSKCDTVIPVCVCPTDTDLRVGECVKVHHPNANRPVQPVNPWAPTPFETTRPTTVLPPVNVGPEMELRPYQPHQTVQPLVHPYEPASTPKPFLPPVIPYEPKTRPLQPQTMQTPKPSYPSSIPSYQTIPPTYQTAVPSYQTIPPTYQTKPTQPPTYPTFQTAPPATAPPPTQRPPPQATGPSYNKINTPPPQNVKHNLVKLGGSKQAGVGVRCSLNTDCMIGAYCNGNTSPPSCQCLSTHVNVEGRCEKVIYPGQIGCQSDLQCTAAYTGTSCIDRLCVCPEGNKAVDQTCVPANEIITSPPGGSCSGERECTGGSVCREGWCICPHHTMIVQKGICVQTQSRPTLPPKIATYPSTPTNPPTAPPSFATAVPTQAGRKAAPGQQCGPLDQCVGNSMCVEGLCLCPAGTSASEQGRCEPIRTPAPTTTTEAATVKYAKPEEDCTMGEICAGGSECREKTYAASYGDAHATKVCVCPSDKPVARGDFCVPATADRKSSLPGEGCDQNTDCAGGSSCEGAVCRCAAGFVGVGGRCVPNPTTTPPAVRFAAPHTPCEDGETCMGGSTCDDETGMCMCPAGQIVMNQQCKPTPQPQRPASPNQCQDDSHCPSVRMCMAGSCKCRPGYVDNGGKCEPLEAVDFNERPAPVSYARHKVVSLDEEEAQQEETDPPTTSKPTPRPRVKGPPIRRPRPKPAPKSGSSSGGGHGSALKTGNGNGLCPPGNEPTRDESSGKIIVCNGLEPNCPPRSYCYITSGGFATEEYNCCKSW